MRYENVTGLSLRRAASQRAVVSLDVLEHVPDYRAAPLREFARVTEPWRLVGAHRAIQRWQNAASNARAVLADGSVEHLHPAEYHGDPMGGEALCFHHFGWDLLDDLRAAGYRDAAIVFPWWPEAGLFDALATIVARDGGR